MWDRCTTGKQRRFFFLFSYSLNIFLFYCRQSETAKALECFEGALVKCQRDSDDDPYYNQISVTIRYNLGRVYEKLCQHDKVIRVVMQN